MTGEKTPLLPKQDFGYRDINSDDVSSSSMSTKVDVQQIDYVNPTNQLSDQPWKYKLVALLCAMFLAGIRITFHL